MQVYFASVGGDIGSRSEQDLIETFVRIAQFPKGFQVRFRHFRYAPLGSFKYVVIYSLEGKDVVVHRVRHMHRKPLKRYFGR